MAVVQRCKVAQASACVSEELGEMITTIGSSAGLEVASPVTRGRLREARTQGRRSGSGAMLREMRVVTVREFYENDSVCCADFGEPLLHSCIRSSSVRRIVFRISLGIFHGIAPGTSRSHGSR